MKGSSGLNKDTLLSVVTSHLQGQGFVQSTYGLGRYASLLRSDKIIICYSFLRNQLDTDKIQ